MSDDWIYIGADIYRYEWSKIGKTTRGLNTRHTSSQNPGYFIYTAYNIVRGDVHEIETKLLNRVESIFSDRRLLHFSTGSKSECFFLNPNEITYVVEDFIEEQYSSCVFYEDLPHTPISRYQCDPHVYRMFEKSNTSFGLGQNSTHLFNDNMGYGVGQNIDPSLDEDIEFWHDKTPTDPPNNLGLSRNNYFSGNQIQHETDLGDGNFVDHSTGMHGYRYEDGSVEWRE
ncbi:hypothetical protein [Psychrobacter sp. MES7-P7E]|uniref:hypothetical protein n=1 Tax=Psychrobacter sp. MES7-P7E TaxID=2058322 RepID=UPI000C7F3F8E|nr:hypothetical protein [Psychrobacter sp. MES7-P7E]PLT22447.1 hypothetical protein CXF62_04765 [Psychrobacter sp. MES7-P7E]|tara:strand:- start:1002 stop:1685 length:684 start_codon:yes stop_codon:yes gene_type:complete